MELNFNSEKIQLIQLLLNTENPSTIRKVKDLLVKENPKALSKSDIINRANQSEIAFQNGNTLTVDELEKEVANW